MNEYLYMFLDESGDFNFSTTGTRYFTFTSILGKRPFIWDNDLLSLKHDVIESDLDLEYFHATYDKQWVRDGVFKYICPHLSNVRIDSIIIDKPKTGPALRLVERFYPEMLGYLLKYVFKYMDFGKYEGVIIITDRLPVKKKRDIVEKTIKQSIAGILGKKTKYAILHHESKSSLELQVVDYCNWAIFRKWERKDPRSYDLIRECVKSEFEIFQSGITRYY